MSAGRPCIQLSYWLILVLLVTLAGRVGAQEVASCEAALTPSPRVEGKIKFLLAVDGLDVPPDIRGLEDVVRLTEGLRHKVNTNLESIEIELSTSESGNRTRTSFEAVPCPQRQPRGKPGESDAKRFLNNNVVLELWGFFDGHEAIFSHAILPIFVHGGGEFADPGDVLALNYTYEAAANGGSVPELIFLKKILLESSPLRAYSAIGAAARALQMKEYDFSWRYYCSTRQILLDQQSEVGELSKTDRKLLEYAGLMASEVVVAAKGDPDYRGALGTEFLATGSGCEGLNQ